MKPSDLTDAQKRVQTTAHTKALPESKWKASNRTLPAGRELAEEIKKE